MAGLDDAPERMARAAKSYGSSRQITPSILWPNGGIAGFEPLLDQILGDNHLVRVRLAPGAKSAWQSHDCDQVMIVVEVALARDR